MEKKKGNKIWARNKSLTKMTWQTGEKKCLWKVKNIFLEIKN